jgi:hypothetical protein
VTENSLERDFGKNRWARCVKFNSLQLGFGCIIPHPKPQSWIWLHIGRLHGAPACSMLSMWYCAAYRSAAVPLQSQGRHYSVYSYVCRVPTSRRGKSASFKRPPEPPSAAMPHAQSVATAQEGTSPVRLSDRRMTRAHPSTSLCTLTRSPGSTLSSPSSSPTNPAGWHAEVEAGQARSVTARGV